MKLLFYLGFMLKNFKQLDSIICPIWTKKKLIPLKPTPAAVLLQYSKELLNFSSFVVRCTTFRPAQLLYRVKMYLTWTLLNIVIGLTSTHTYNNNKVEVVLLLLYKFTTLEIYLVCVKCQLHACLFCCLCTTSTSTAHIPMPKLWPNLQATDYVSYSIHCAVYHHQHACK